MVDWLHGDRPRKNRWTDRSFQKQCKRHGQHDAHYYARTGGLVWYCQGRGSS